jgi:hypothetical protein
MAANVGALSSADTTCALFAGSGGERLPTYNWDIAFSFDMRSPVPAGYAESLPSGGGASVQIHVPAVNARYFSSR